MDNIINFLPPRRCTAMRINPKTQSEEERNADENEPLSALVFKTMADPYVGKLTLFRIYSGMLKSDTAVYNPNKDQMERIAQIYLVTGKKQEPVDQAQAGDLVAVAKLQHTTTGDTLCDKEKPIILKEIQFPKPVYTAAISPKAKGDEEKISAGLSRLAEDPTLK